VGERAVLFQELVRKERQLVRYVYIQSYEVSTPQHGELKPQEAGKPEDPRRQGQLVRLRKSWQAFTGSSRGFTIIEVLIALAILGMVAVAFLSALATASTALILADERTTAESLTRAQLEYVKSWAYIPTAPEAVYYDAKITWLIPDYYDVKGLGKDGYVSYPVINYSDESDDIIGVAWDSASCSAAADDTGLQIVTVIIYHGGTRVLTTTAYKAE
jgi:prepilin-type N-terminal cleavage/methylation domain-containing protein